MLVLEESIVVAAAGRAQNNLVIIVYTAAQVLRKFASDSEILGAHMSF